MSLPFIQRARTRSHKPRLSLTLPAIPRSSGPIYVCPLSNLPFCGLCPVVACPGHKQDVKPHGCLFIQMKRTKLDRADILFSYGLNEKKLHDALHTGQESVLRAVSFYKTLNKIRASDDAGYCPHCGVGHRQGVYRCENIALCEDRRKTSQDILENSYLSFPEMQGQIQDVYRIARHLKTFESGAHDMHSNIEQLLGVSHLQLKTLQGAVTFL